MEGIKADISGDISVRLWFIKTWKPYLYRKRENRKCSINSPNVINASFSLASRRLLAGKENARSIQMGFREKYFFEHIHVLFLQ